jgi:nucleotide-binding universal stress UspA family protein
MSNFNPDFVTHPNTLTVQRMLSAHPTHILVPTDFSEVAHNAFIYALHLAESAGARITLLHVCFEAPVDSRFVPKDFVEALRQEKTDNALHHFEAYQREAQSGYGKNIEVETRIEYGYVASTLIETINSVQPELVIMGTMGVKGPGVKILGSVTAEVIEKAAVPVLAIPDKAEFQPFRHIMYATNFQQEDVEFIRQLAGFAKAWKARLSCAHIKTEEESWSQMDPAFFSQISQLETGDGAVGFYVSHHPNVVEGISRFAQNYHVDLIAMLTHRRFEIDRLYDQSMTKEMTLHTQLPLLAFHDRD